MASPKADRGKRLTIIPKDDASDVSLIVTRMNQDNKDNNNDTTNQGIIFLKRFKKGGPPFPPPIESAFARNRYNI